MGFSCSLASEDPAQRVLSEGSVEAGGQATGLAVFNQCASLYGSSARKRACSIAVPSMRW